MFKSVKKLFISTTVLIGIFAVASFVLAQAPDLGLGYGSATGLAAADPRIIVANIIRIALGFLGVVAIGLIIYGGYLWMTAAGNEEQIERAKKVLISAIIGLVIILSAFGIATFILNSLLQATGNSNGEGSPCSDSATSCIPDSGLCTVGTCDNTCHCNSHITPGPTPGPGQKCGGGSLGVCGDVCAEGSTCNSDCVCVSNNITGTPCGTVTAGVCQQNLACGGNDFCDTANSDPAKLCTCQPQVDDGGSCDSDAVLPGCQPTDNCHSGSACDFSSCTCKSSIGVGSPCDATTTVGVCQPSSNLCSNNLTCESSGAKACTCQKHPVVDWISPVGGFCSKDPNTSCTSDANCSGTPGSTCDTGTANAAPGNIISIGGEYFGPATGTVDFTSSTGLNAAGKSPKTVNPNCVSSWADNQIIIVVPNQAISGPLKIISRDGTSTETDLQASPKINNVVINTIVRPGLCQVTSPGKLGSTVYYNGVNFSNASADFGSYTSSILGVNSKFNANNGETVVPNFSAGDTTTFVSDTVSKQNSNYLEFTNSSTPALGAFISSFDPSGGPVGQYVTIHGNGFGYTQGKSQVYFGDAVTGVPADFNFPSVCADSIWGNQQIIVKVPQGIGAFNDILTIVLDNGQTLTTESSTPRTFQVNNSPLTPSLCKISPTIGVAGTTVNLWGEYFDPFDENSGVSFFHNQSAVIANASNWDGKDTPNNIKTTVPASAATGLVKVVKGATALSGNGLNFSVGSCLQAPDPSTVCGSQFCCPANTYKAGACVDNVAEDCAVTATTSVYQFSFNTTIGTGTPGTFFGSCQEESNSLGACKDQTLCPNSPGACSLFAGDVPKSLGACDSSCNSVSSCQGGQCTYQSTLNKCVLNSSSCTLGSTIINAAKTSVPVYCALYNGTPRLVYNEAKSVCTTSAWKLDKISVNGADVSVCVNLASTCGLCNSGFDCVNLSGAGTCASPATICPAGSTCNSSNNECEQNSNASCSCCCRKNNVDPTTKQNLDCCGGLKCEGTCGSDAGKTDTGTYGSCGGCKTPGGDQTSWDKNCNCTGTSGKFCDTSDPNFTDGVCRDCAQLSLDPAACSEHSGYCCVDGTKNNTCVNLQYGSNPTDVFGLAPYSVLGPAVNYCAYYQCYQDAGSCVLDRFAETGKGFSGYPSQSECTAKCQTTPAAGASCAGTSTPSQASATCNTSICGNPLACLQSSGISAPLSGDADACGVCCCDPKQTGQCGYLTKYKPDATLTLSCVPNVGPCAGAGRGLCCGCKSNDDCAVSGDPVDQGCGSDTCCRTRPNVINASTTPVNGASNVCANAQIQVTFDQQMNVSSFGKNFVLIYKQDVPCASVSLKGSKGIVSSAIDLLRRHLTWIFGQESQASFGGYHCQVKGNVLGKQEGKSSTLIFVPDQPLLADTQYYAVVKGTDNIASNTVGVLSYWGVSLNEANSPIPDDSSDYSLMGAYYPNSYVWSFTTKASNGEDNGLCAIDHVSVFPNSYLFHTTANDLNENDVDPNSRSFDTADDRDKVFAATAYSNDDQILHPASGYAWVWNWSIVDNTNPIVSFVNDNSTGNYEPFAPTDSSQLVKANDGVVDSETQISAQISLTDTTISSKGDNDAATADIYVFICTSTWPDKQPDGVTWRPWRDTVDATFANGCKAAANFPGSTCGAMNYELYYCRDTGNTTKPLPAVTAPVTSLGSNLGCTDASGSCAGKAVGDPCGTGGTCQDLLKESYFFSQGLLCTDNAAGKDSCDNKSIGDPCGTGSGTCQEPAQ
jgi:Type IV secretion system pilin/Bacterial Ig-like domain/IPT/TIG domain